MSAFIVYHHWTPTAFFSMTLKQLFAHNEFLGRDAQNAAIAKTQRETMKMLRDLTKL